MRIHYREVLDRLKEKGPGRRCRRPDGRGMVTREQCEQEIARLDAEFAEVEVLLAQAFMLLADNIARYTKFQHVDIDDAIQDCVLVCFQKIHRFDPSLGKAFSYVTQIMINSLRQNFRYATSYIELKAKYQKHLENVIEVHLGKQYKNKFKDFSTLEKE